MVKKLIAALLLSVLVVLFTLQNTAPCPLNGFGFTVNLPLALMLVIAFGVGVIVALLLLLPISLRDRRKYTRLKRELEEIKRSRNQEEAGRQRVMPEDPSQEIPDIPEN